MSAATPRSSTGWAYRKRCRRPTVKRVGARGTWRAFPAPATANRPHGRPHPSLLLGNRRYTLTSSLGIGCRRTSDTRPVVTTTVIAVEAGSRAETGTRLLSPPGCTETRSPKGHPPVDKPDTSRSPPLHFRRAASSAPLSSLPHAQSRGYGATRERHAMYGERTPPPPDRPVALHLTNATKRRRRRTRAPAASEDACAAAPVTAATLPE